MKVRIFQIIILVISLLIVSCSANKKIIKEITKAKGTMNTYPDSFAYNCDKLFPIKETFIKGKDSVINKEIIVKGDSIACPGEIGKPAKYVKCPDIKVSYKEIFRIDTIVKESTALSTSLKNKLQESNNRIIQLDVENKIIKKQSAKKLFWSISLLVLLLGSLYINIKKFISF